MAQPDTAVLLQHNDDFPWDSFDSEWYLKHNYGTMRDDDQRILELLAEFFDGLGDRRQRVLRHDIEVGTGTNLYPILAALPLCSRITLHERAATNCQWLRKETASFSRLWTPYWDVLAERELYRPIRDPRWAVHDRTCVRQGTIFGLPRAAYDLGTMFFVAEGITERVDEFTRATRIDEHDRHQCVGDSVRRRGTEHRRRIDRGHVRRER